jgi:hypothetical protein
MDEDSICGMGNCSKSLNLKPWQRIANTSSLGSKVKAKKAERPFPFLPFAVLETSKYQAEQLGKRCTTNPS